MFPKTTNKPGDTIGTVSIDFNFDIPKTGGFSLQNLRLEVFCVFRQVQPAGAPAGAPEVSFRHKWSPNPAQADGAAA